MRRITENIYHVADSGCSVFLIDTRSEEGLVLIDAGMDARLIRRTVSQDLSFENIHHCVLTHCHIDHIHACAGLKKMLPDLKFYAHSADADSIEQPGHDKRTAASWYGVRFEPVHLHLKFDTDIRLDIGGEKFECIHTPGHTPGSISVLITSGKKKVLFGQDLHGPFNDDFLSDLTAYQVSMNKLLALGADVLCEGHFGVFQPADQVRRYIESHMRRNKPG